MLHAVSRNILEIVAFALVIAPVLADDPAATVPLVIIGSPLPTAIIGDARHCPTGLAPSEKLAADQIRFHLRSGDRASIALSDRRDGRLCGGSLNIVPETGKYYAARLTPGRLCEAQLIRIDPNAKPSTTLIGHDNHPELDKLICATQQGAPESSRFSAANQSGGAVTMEIGTDGICGKFGRVDRENASGVELGSGMKTWVHVMFRIYLANGIIGLNACDVKLAFTPAKGFSYFVDYGEGAGHCVVQLLQADGASAVVMTPTEKVPAQPCP